MAIIITCQACNKGYKLKDELAGKKVKCKCGHSMVVPKPKPKSAADPLISELGSLDDGDPMSSLLDDALPPAGATAALAKPTGPIPAPAAGSPTFPKPLVRKEVTGDYRRVARIAREAAGYAAQEAAKEAAKQSGPDATKLALISVVIVFGLALGTVGLGVGVYWWRQPGFRTIEETFTVHQESLRDKNWKMQFRTFTPERQDKILTEMAYSVLPAANSSPLIAAVLKEYEVTQPAAEDEETYADILAELMPEEPDDAPFDPNRERTPEEIAEAERIDAEIDRRLEALNERSEQRRTRVISHVKNKPAFYAALMKAMAKEEKKARDATTMPAIVKMIMAKEIAEARRADASRKLANVQIDGDTAQGHTTPALAMGDMREAEPISFRRIDGRWYIDLTKEEPLDEEVGDD